MKNKLLSVLAIAGMCLAPVAAQAMPIGVGTTGTFVEQGGGAGTDLFTITNTSDAGVKITKIVLDLSGSFGGVFFDTALGLPGDDTNAAPYVAIPGSVGFNLPTGGSAGDDGSTLLTIFFGGFDAGETFSFTIDTDDIGEFVSGADFAGSLLTATYNGDFLPRNTTLSAAYVDPVETAFDEAEVSMSANVQPVPEPASLLLLGTGIAGLVGWRARRANRANV